MKDTPGWSVPLAFSEDGPLQRGVRGFEPRPQQLEMATAVEEAFSSERPLLVEAGTGTGKTLAYLVPALLSGKKVVVSTATKNLQEQIFTKDLPLLRGAGLDFTAAYLKGRANYLCLQRFAQFDQQPSFARREDVATYPKFRAWALATETGDRAEADIPESYEAWSQVSISAEACLGHKCPHYEACFVTRARQRAKDADLVVVNHHLFFADLALRGRLLRGDEGVLPRYDAVVFDEAHALEEVATEYFGVQVSSFRLSELIRDAQAALPPSDERGGMLSALAVKAGSAADRLFRALPQALGLPPHGSVRLTPRSFACLRSSLEEVVSSLSGLAAYAAGAEEPEVAAIGRRSGELSSELAFVAKAESPDHAYWVEGSRRGVFLRAAPIDIAAELQQRLYGQVGTMVFTSATLTTEGTFDHFVRRMGLSPQERALQVSSPFDFSRQAALYLPKDLPEPQAPEFTEAASERILELLRISGGRAFVLFTSLRSMDAVYRRLEGRLDVPLLKQGDRPKTALLEQFKERPSVLLAAQSFWEGVDVPGEALSMVVIEKLPFASPTDPMVASRIERIRSEGGEPFSSYQLPEAAISLRQGFGRLIRSSTDRGIVAVLDRRIVAKSYGRVFLHSLPPARRFHELPALAAWFEQP